jgi:uncharacterized protein (TIGR03086 family)
MAPDLAPADELDSAEATLGVLRQVLRGIGPDDLDKQTPCRKFDVAALSDHLMNSITAIGEAAGAELPQRNSADSLDDQVSAAAGPALAAWRRRGLDGTVIIGPNELPAKMMAGILSIEFLVHAWDFAAATGGTVNAPDALPDYVLGLAKTIITPQGRSNVGFDDAVDVAADAGALDRLIAFTGRQPA